MWIEGSQTATSQNSRIAVTYWTCTGKACFWKQRIGQGGKFYATPWCHNRSIVSLSALPRGIIVFSGRGRGQDAASIFPAVVAGSEAPADHDGRRLRIERFHADTRNEVTSYVFFMDKLINSTKNVSLLHWCGILQNSLGSNKAIAKLFNSLLTDACLKSWQQLRDCARGRGGVLPVAAVELDCLRQAQLLH
ncbi:hypothetical protein C2S52_005795 [Perilla frutescens var. hirtella]|nr:hypothetical protein C2S52_005795 [Perilla frutescens var. hirtella]